MYTPRADGYGDAVKHTFMWLNPLDEEVIPATLLCLLNMQQLSSHNSVTAVSVLMLFWEQSASQSVHVQQRSSQEKQSRDEQGRRRKGVTRWEAWQQTPSPQALVRVYEPTEGPVALPGLHAHRPATEPPLFLRGNKIYVLGGRQGKLPVTAFEAFDLEVKSWTRYPCIPSRRAFSSCTATERAFFSLGGLQQPGPHNFYSRPHFVSTVEEYDPEQGIWLKPTWGSRMREKRADFVAGCLGGRVIVAGGLGNQPSPLESVESYNHVKRRWEAVAPLPTPRCSCTPLQTPNTLFLIGGVSQGPSNAVEALCLRENV
ncbi:kelch domain-containing protein 8B-like [Brachyhypopomus gauderio]|uniref:kelch domain-containing protein 8B-like n=1 Tax=Brachyhypopomus gauderio TaxID=698409 RepID=UPI004041D3D3